MDRLTIQQPTMWWQGATQSTWSFLSSREHEVCGYDRAIRSITCQLGPVVEARDDLLQSVSHAVRGSDKSGAEHFARRGPDSESTRDGQVRLHVGHGGAKADAHARDRAYEAGWRIAWWSARWIWSYGAP